MNMIILKKIFKESKKNSKMKIVDCFLFYNELDMLEFRLKELNDVVDYFVLVESTYTFMSHPKELYYEKNKSRFEKYKDKIVHIIVEDMKLDKNPWQNEFFQRNCIDRGIKKLNLDSKDIIIIADCDEIPDSDTLKLYKNKGVENICSLEMDLYYYNLRCRHKIKWFLTKILSYEKYLTMDSIQHIRRTKNVIIPKGGWHFSYFGDVNFIKNKIKEFSHQEFNSSEYLDEKKIMEKIENCKDLFSRNDENWERVELENNKYLPNNVDLLLKKFK